MARLVPFVDIGQFIGVQRVLRHAERQGVQRRVAPRVALLDGREYVVPDDVKTIAPDVLRHRVMISYEAEAEEITADQVINRVFDAVEVP